MGLNPFRAQAKRGTDLVIVAIARGGGGARALGGVRMTHGAADELEIADVQPYQAVKIYRCPGCDHEIARGLGHEVVMPKGVPQERRHWHTGCWRRAERQRTRAR